MSSVKSDSDFDEVNNVDNITEIQETVGQEGNGSTELSPEGETITIQSKHVFIVYLERSHCDGSFDIIVKSNSVNAHFLNGPGILASNKSQFCKFLPNNRGTSWANA